MSTPDDVVTLLDRACALGRLTETQHDGLTDELARGDRDEHEIFAELLPVMQEAELAWLCVGRRAALLGLVARPELNGQEVALLQPVGDRWKVQPVTWAVSAGTLSVRPLNLWPCKRLLQLEQVDLLQSCLEQLDGQTLRSAQATCRLWSTWVNVTIRSVEWRAQHFSLSELLRGEAPDAAVLRRLETHAHELLDESHFEEEVDEEGDELDYTTSPLVLALRLGASARVVEAMLNRLRRKGLHALDAQLCDEDHEGLPPLCAALDAGASPAVIRLLLREYLDFVARLVEDASDYAVTFEPLHIAARHCDRETMLMLLEVWPAAGEPSESWHSTPLHVALGAEDTHSRPSPPFDEAKSDAVLLLLRAAPEAARVRNKGNALPLHVALRAGAPAALVLEILAACPEVAAWRDGDVRDMRGAGPGYLPTHYALGAAIHLGYGRHRASSEAVQTALLKAHPSAEWPLMDLVRGAAESVEIEAEALRRICDQPSEVHATLGREDGEGWTSTLLHLAAQHSAPTRVIAALCSADAPALQRFDSRGYLPLHYAATEAAVRMLAQAWPAALNLHGASRMVKASLRARKAEAESCRWPLYRAIQLHAPDSVIRTLEELTPNLDAFGNRPEPVRFMRKCSQRDMHCLRRSASTRAMRLAMGN